MSVKRALQVMPILLLLALLVQTKEVKADNTSGFWSYEVYDDGTVGITAYSGLDEEIAIPSEIEGKIVTKIANNAFRNNENIKGVIIPFTVTTIGSQAFAGSGLVSVTIPETVTTWEEIRYTNLPSGAGEYYEYMNGAFAECKNLQNVIFESATVPSWCFYECESLATVTLGNKTQYIKKHAFENNVLLSEINVYTDLLEIGTYCFRNCEILETINLGNSLLYIGSQAFAGSGLVSITIPETVTTWEEVIYTKLPSGAGDYYDYMSGAFAECWRLSNVVINCETVPSWCFNRCFMISEVILGEKTKYIEEYAFENNYAMKTCDVKSDLLSIGKYSFRCCEDLKAINLGCKLSYIGFQAFANTGIKEVTIPDTVNWGIGTYAYLPSGAGNYYDDYSGAFAECLDLKDIYFGNITLPEQILYGSTGVTIHCMSGSSAHNYAINNGFSYEIFEAIPSTSVALATKEYTLVKGETLVLHPIVTPANSTDTISWTSGNENIATVDATGLVNAKATGLVAMKCTTSSGKSYSFNINIVASGTTTVDKEPSKNIALSTIEGISNKEYTGSAITQNVTVKFNPYTELIENVHYKVVYQNNVNAGTATVVIEAIQGSGYTGEIVKTFKIITFTGMRQIDGTWYYLTNSVIDKKYVGLASNQHGWWYIKNGQVDFSYTGLAKNNYGWWYVNKGKLDTTYTGLAKNEYGWWYVNKGKLDTTYTGLAKNEYGWWYVKKGKLDTTYTGMAKNEYGWWYLKNGTIDFKYTGLAKNQYGWWYIKNGKMDTSYTGMAKNEHGWWHVTKGKLDTTYTGISSNSYGMWYMKKGKLDTTFSGTIKHMGVTYAIKSGKVVK